MQPCSCGVAHEDTCPVSRSQSAMPEVFSDLPQDKVTAGCAPVEASASDQSPKSKSKAEASKSTLIEFPGVSRAVPEWRKQLSQRVREVQELRAREASERFKISRRGPGNWILIDKSTGKASGEYEDFVTGFVTPEGTVWGRPVGITVAKDGSLLISEDGDKTIWRVSYGK